MAISSRDWLISKGIGLKYWIIHEFDEVSEDQYTIYVFSF